MNISFSTQMLDKLYEFAQNNSKIAIVDKSGSRKTSYHDFIQITNAIAYWMCCHDICKGDVVAIELGRCMEHYAVRLACFFIGAVYLSIGTKIPKKRLNKIHKECRPKLVVDSSFLKNLVLDDYSCQINTDVADDSYGYLVYTSGTSAQPKCVVHDRSFAKLYEGVKNTFYVPEYRKIGINFKSSNINHAAVSDPSFILSLADMSYLFMGKTVHIISEDLLADGLSLKKYLVTKKIDSIFILPSALSKLLPLPDLKLAMVVGEKSTYDFSQYKTKVYNLYGASESPVISFHEATINNVIGKCIDGGDLFLSNGSSGEICYKGPDVFVEYLNNKSLTNMTLKINNDGQRIFHTKDRGIKLEDGTIQLLGRMDTTVKIRGMRVDLAEVESVLSKIKDIKEAVVKTFIYDDETVIAAFYSTFDKQNLNHKSLKRILSNNLNDYMIPARFIYVDDFKRNEHGKINTQSLKLSVQNESSNNQRKYMDKNVDFSYNGIVDYLTYQSSQILHGIQVEPDSNLMSLGFNSLNAMELQSIISKHYGVNITATEMMKLSSVNLIAKKVKSILKSNSTGNSVLNKYTFRDKVPLSESQLNVYLDEISKNGCGTAYNNPVKIIIKGDFSVKNITDSVKSLLTEFPILRARIDSHEENPLLSFDANIKVLKKDKPYKVDNNFVRPFKLNRGLARFTFVNNNKDKMLYADFHHIIADGMSINILLTQLYKYLNVNEINYNEIESDTGILKECEFSKKIQETPRFKNAKNFFDKELCEADQAGILLASIGSNKPNSIHGRLKFKSSFLYQFLAENSLTLNQFLISVFGYTLSRYCGSDNSLFCVIEDGRGQIDLSDSVGMFVKTMPIMLDCSNKFVAEFLHASKNKILKIFDYDFYPFRLLAKDYGVNTSITFQYSHNIRTNKYQNIDFFELKHDYVSEFSLNIYDLLDSKLAFILEHSKKYSDEFCKDFMSTFEKVLHGFLIKDELSDINLVTNTDLRIYSLINKTEKKLKYTDILQAFMHSLSKYPNNTLVTYKDKTYTYAQGACISQSIANTLDYNKIKQKSHVAILVNRSEWYMLASLGVLTHGSAYVPIDDTYPDSRISFMLKDTCASAVLVTDKTLMRSEKLAKDNNLNSKIINLSKINIPTQQKAERQSQSYVFANTDKHDTACVFYTSGTTGKPKGSLITRLAIINFSEWFASVSQMHNTDTYALYASFGFDVHLEIFSSLLKVATVDIVPSNKRLNINSLVKYCEDTKITVSEFPVSLVKLMQDVHIPESLKVLHTGGEALGKTKLKAKCLLIDAYGPTENTVACIWIDTKQKMEFSSIGSLIMNNKFYILDSNKHLLPKGAVGELYLSGYQLAKGYLNRKRETNDAFVDNPFDGDKPQYKKMYKTGDMVRLLPDNTLGFIGRRDTQIKIRGNRVETGEIESCIRELKEIKDTTVQAIDINNTKELVVYCVLEKNADTHDIEQTVKTYVSNNKPAYMIPSFVEVLKKIPLNANGKVDKRNLPIPKVSSLQAEYVPAQTKTQALIISAFEKVLGLDKIGIYDDFVRLGGDSLSAIKVVSILNDLGITVSSILSLKTPSAISMSCKDSIELNKIIEKYNQQKLYPLSSPQLNIYYDQITNYKDKAYRIFFTIKVSSSYTTSQIKKALQTTINAHPILSMCVKQVEDKIYMADGKDPQIKSIKSKNELHSDIDINIFSGPLVYFFIHKSKRNTQVHGLVHHLVFDGKSEYVFKNDFLLALENKTLNKETYFISISALNEQANSSGLIKKDYAFFDEMLSAGENIVISPLPCSNPGYITCPIEANLKQIQDFCNKHSITDTSYLCAAFAYTYSIFTSADTSYFCMTDNGRDLSGADDAIGMFVKNIPLAVNCTINDTVAYIKEVFDTLYSAKDAMNMPIANLAKKYSINYSIMFQYFSEYLFDSANKSIDDINKQYTSLLSNEQTIADLDFYLTKLSDGYGLMVTHSKKYSKDLVISFINTFSLIVGQMYKVEHLSDIELIKNNTYNIYKKLNNTNRDLRFKTVLEAFRHYVNKYPDKTALVCEDDTYSYKELDGLSNSLAQSLINEKINKGDCVAIYLSISANYLIAALAIMKAGAIYVPINTDYPDNWVKEICKYSKIKAVIINSNDGVAFPYDAKNIDICNTKSKIHFRCVSFDKNDTACVLFTSGSSGMPKGVMIRHVSIANLCNFHVDFLNYNDKSICGMYQNISFVSHIEPMYAPLFKGCVVDIVPKFVRNNMRKLNRYIDSHNITHIKMGASIGRHFIEQADTVKLKYLLLGGEKLGKIQRDTSYKVIDGYGSTENSAQVLMSYYENKNYVDSVGYPIYNTKIFILDRYKRLLPKCAQGILFSCGLSTSKGYLKNRSLTKKSFFQNLYKKDLDYSVLYSTGDMSRMLPDGSIGIIGRNDIQVQIRGNRVEPSEVEACIREIEQIKDVIVQAINVDKTKELVAYCVLDKSTDKKYIDQTIKSHVSNNKPAYMVPAFVEILDKIPINVNGKVDKRKLPTPNASDLQAEYVPAQTETQASIIDAFERVLNINPIGINDDFIRLGGDSLSAIRVVSALKEANVSANDLLTYKTPALIEEAIKSNELNNLDLDINSIREKTPLNEPQLNVYLDIKKNNKVDSYLLPNFIKLDDKYSYTDIKEAIKRLHKAHTILNKKVLEDESGVFLVNTDVLDISDQQTYNKQEIEEFLTRTFNLNKNLSRYLIVHKDRKTYLVCVFHHLIFDGLSSFIFISELDKALNKITLNKDILYLFSSAFAQKIICTDKYKAANNFFERELCEAGEVSELLPDIDGKAGNYVLTLDSDLKTIKDFTKYMSITPSTFMTSVFAYTLSRYTGSDNVQINIIDNGRDRFKNTDSSIGMFVNTLPIIFDCTNTDIKDYLKTSNTKIYKTLEYNFIGYRNLANKYDINSSVMFQYDPLEYFRDIDIDNTLDLNISNHEAQDFISDISVNVVADKNKIHLSITHSNKYSHATIKSIAKCFNMIVAGMLTKNRLSDINLVTEDDLATFSQINKTETKLKYNDILKAFMHSLIKYPNNALVTYKDNMYTYAQGAYVATQIVNILNKANIKKKSNIAILVNRSEWYMLAPLGVLTHGSVYIPIDDTYPDTRITFMLKDTSADAILITDKTKARAEKLIQTNKLNTKIINLDKISILSESQVTNQAKTYSYTNQDKHYTACILYTSGTTGKPKGSLITRSAINNLAFSVSKFIDANKEDVFGQYASFAFDVCLEALYTPMYLGASCCILPSTARLDANKFKKCCKDYCVSFIHLPSAVFKAFNKAGVLDSIKNIFAGGESLGHVDFENNNKFVNKEHLQNIYETYGPTEATVSVTRQNISSKITVSSIGIPTLNTKIYILDSNKQQAPVGAVGELYLSGYQLAKGYLNRKQETQKAFIDNPFDGDDPEYEKMYKTGDMVMLLPDNTLGFVGRRDSQIKIRGNRVEVSEVEACIRELETIIDVAVQAVDINNTKELVAYCTLNKNTDTKGIEQTVKTYVRDNKPAYMVPAFIEVLDKIPLNVNGKVDKKSLPYPNTATLDAKYVPAYTKIQQTIVNAFEEVLGVERIGINDDFVRLGGDSLSAIKVSSILKDYNITANNLLTYKTPLSIESAIKANELSTLDLDIESIKDKTPLNEAQLNVYLDIKKNSKIDSYLISNIIEIDNAYNYADIKRAVKNLHNVHTILNKKIYENKSGIYLVNTDTLDFKVLQKYNEQQIVEFLTHPFNLYKNLSRYLIVYKENKTYLACVCHHLVFDGLSHAIFESELKKALQNKELNQDYLYLYSSAFAQSIKDTDKYIEANNFFEKELCESNELFELLPDIDGKAGSYTLTLDADLKHIKDYSQNLGITSSTFMTSAFAYTLSRYTGSDKVLINLLENGRDRFKNINTAIGMFVNTLPIIFDCSDKDIKDYLHFSNGIILKTLEYNFIGYRELSNKYNVDSTLLFQYDPQDIFIDNVTIDGKLNIDLGNKNRRDFITELNVKVIENGDRVKIFLEHSDKYSLDKIKSIAKSFNKVVDGMLVFNKLSDICLTTEEDQEIFTQINNTETELKHSDILEAFTDSLKLHPNNKLVIYKNKSYTYAQGASIAQNICIQLNNNHIATKSNIAIFVDRSEWYLLAALGTLTHGSAYVPIDDTYPDSRISFMLQDTSLAAILVTNKTVARIEKLIDKSRLNIKIINLDKINIPSNSTSLDMADLYTYSAPSKYDTACILYTSGTTGTPKGNLITRLHFINISEWYSSFANITHKAIFGMHSTFVFDMHIYSMFSCFIQGACIDIIDSDTRLNIENLANYINKNKITHTVMSTQMGKLLSSYSLPALSHFAVAGEALGDIYTDNMMFDLYGPTECNVVSAIKVSDKIISSSIGSIVANTKAYILDNNKCYVPKGAVGELYLSGYQLSKGYLNLKKEANNSFMDNIFDGDKPEYKKMYKTGDMVRLLPDNTIGFVGRCDSQIKIRGNRVEAYEVESCIRGLEQIIDVTVQAIDVNNTKELVSYCVLNRNVDIKDIEQTIKTFVGNNKPSYMVPAFIVIIDKIPLNKNGKVDKKSLPYPNIECLQSEYVPAQTKIQDSIIDAFENVLDITKIGINDDFVRLGGDSLSAIKVVSLLKDYKVSANDLLTYKTPLLIEKTIKKNELNDLDLDIESIKDKTPLNESQLNVYLDIKKYNKIDSYLIRNIINIDNKYSYNDIESAIKKFHKAHSILNKKICEDANGIFLVDAGVLDIKEQKIYNTHAIEDFLTKPFNLNMNLSRYLVSHKENLKYLVCVFHHIIFDGLSDVIFKSELDKALQNNNLNQDYLYLYSSAYAQSIKDTDKYKEAIHFFERDLCEANELSDLLPDIEGNAGSCALELDTDLEHVKHFTRRLGITPSSFMTSVFAYTLSRYTGSDKVLINIIDNGRDRFKNAENAIGMFVNTLPIVFDCLDTSVKDYLQTSNEKIYKTLENDFIGYRNLANKYDINSSVMFEYDPIKYFEKINLYNALDINLRSHEAQDFISDLGVNVIEDKEKLIININHSNKYSNSTIKSIANCFNMVVTEMLTQDKLSDINLVTDKDLISFSQINKTETSLKYSDILQAFTNSLNKYPNNTLVTYKDKSYTYAQGAHIASKISSILDKNCIERKSHVAIFVDRSEWYLLAALGVLTHGSAYVPIDDSYPDKHVNFMLKDTNARAVLANDKTISRIGKIKDSNNLNTYIINLNNIEITSILSAEKLDQHYLFAIPDMHDTACILYTSGTTGKPKGSLITRAALNNYTNWFVDYANVTNQDNMCMYRSFGFDAGNTGMFVTMRKGGNTYILPQECRFNVNKFVEYSNKNNLTICGGLPGKFIKIVLDNDKLITYKFIVTGGESYGYDFVNAPDVLYDEYGPTESLDAVCVSKMNTKIHHSSIGKLIYNIKGYILDSNLNMVPKGAVGELYLSGFQLAKSYLNQKNKTINAFKDNPFDGDKPGYEKMYKTGDMVRILPDNTLGFIGRKDSQIKIRGNRVEVSEVETCIREIDFVEDTTVITINNNNAKELVAYVVLNDKQIHKNKKNITEEIIKHISDNKPAYMVPAFIEIIDRIPLNVNGKVDKKALPLPNIDSLKTEYVAPTNEIEIAIVEAFEQVLGQENIGIEDDFIRLGGDSLSAIKVVSILKDYSVSANDLLTYKTPRAIEDIIKTNELNRLNLDIEPIKDKTPLNEPQLNVYLDIIKNNKIDSYLISNIVNIDKKYSYKDIKNAINRLHNAHQILNKKIHEDERGVYLVDAGELDIKHQNIFKKQNNEDFLIQAFNLNKNLSRYLVVHKDNKTYLISVFHHIVIDGLSSFIFKSELSKALQNKDLIQDYLYLYSSAFAQSIKDTDKFKEANNFFEKELCDASEVSDLIYDIDGKAGYYTLALDTNLNKVKDFTKRLGITPSIFMTSVFAYTLSRYTGDDKVLINIIDNGRDRFKNTDTAIGMFVNTLPVIFDCSDKSVKDYLISSNSTLLKTLDYNFIGFRNLAKKYGINSEVRFQYDPHDAFQNVDTRDDKTFLNIVERNTNNPNSDLSINVVESDNSFKVVFAHSKKYSNSKIKSIAECLNNVVKEMLVSKRLSDIDFVSVRDKRIYNRINSTETNLKYADILEAFKDSLYKNPDNNLVTYKDTSYTYAQVAVMAQKINSILIENRIKIKSNIAIFVPRSVWYLIGSLGVLTHGSTYVPIDDTYPDERISFMIKDTDASAILVTNRTIKRLNNIVYNINNFSTIVINLSEIQISSKQPRILKTFSYEYAKIHENDIACILYTSGTSGKPKGTLITHLGIINNAQRYCTQVSNISSNDNVAMFPSFGFDCHLESMFSSVYAGANLDIVPNSVKYNIPLLISYLNSHNITNIHFPTAIINIVLEQQIPDCIKTLIVGGSPLGNINKKYSFDFYDGYGPTEAGNNITAIKVGDKIDPSSIGTPLMNTKLYVLDNNLHQVPKYGIGELYISGLQLAKGYLNREKETKEAFLDNPFDGCKSGYEKMYKTGDMVRVLPDGTLGFIGRKDSQIKIRGNRVELGEIENCIRELDEIIDVTVQAIRINNAKELVAYCVLGKNTDINDIEQTVKTYVSNNKPVYMVPAFVELLDTIPLNVNGKVDKRKLPKPNASDLQAEYIPAQTKTQSYIIDAFEKVLGIDKIGIDDDFILLGGDSLKAIRVVSILNKASLTCNATDIFQYKTPRLLSENVTNYSTKHTPNIDIEYNEWFNELTNFTDDK